MTWLLSTMLIISFCSRKYNFRTCVDKVRAKISSTSSSHSNDATLCCFSGSYVYFGCLPKMFTCFNVKEKTHYFCHTGHCTFTCIKLCINYSILVPVSLRPPLLWLVGSHRPQQALFILFLHELCWCFCNHHARGMAQSNDCIAVTSQPYGSPDGPFKGIVSEYGWCVWIELSVLILSQYLLAERVAL